MLLEDIRAGLIGHKTDKAEAVNNLISLSQF